MRLRPFQPIVFAAAALAGAAGCGGAGTKDSQDGYVVVCEDRVVTGSEINRVRCHRKVDMEERRRRDRDYLQHIQNETPRPRTTPTGQ